MKLIAKQAIGIAPGKMVFSGQQFEIEDAAEGKRLVEIGAAEQIMVPAEESKIEEPAAEEKPAAPAAGARPGLTRRS